MNISTTGHCFFTAFDLQQWWSDTVGNSCLHDNSGSWGATRGRSVLFIINGVVKVSRRWLVFLGIKQTWQAYEKEIVFRFRLSLS